MRTISAPQPSRLPPPSPVRLHVSGRGQAEAVVAAGQREGISSWPDVRRKVRYAAGAIAALGFEPAALSEEFGRHPLKATGFAGLGLVALGVGLIEPDHGLEAPSESGANTSE